MFEEKVAATKVEVQQLLNVGFVGEVNFPTL
jgi:hypothetical protein